jgi:hypothetical protein
LVKLHDNLFQSYRQFFSFLIHLLFTSKCT